MGGVFKDLDAGDEVCTWLQVLGEGHGTYDKTVVFVVISEGAKGVGRCL